MQTLEELSKLSAEELENLYQRKKEEFDLKLSKNRRIRGMLSRKVDKQRIQIEELQLEKDNIIKSHPDVVKAEFDDQAKTDKEDPDELSNSIQQLEFELSELQSKKNQLSESNSKITSQIESQRTKEKELVNELDELKINIQKISNEGGDLENEELTQIYREEMAIKEKLEIIIKEIEDLRNKIHTRE